MRKSLLIFLVAIFATSIAFADNIDKLSAGTKVFLQKRAIGELQDTAIIKKSTYSRPKTVNGVEYINCFINLNNASIAELEALGVEVNGVYEHFVTAKVPVNIIEEVTKLGSVKQVGIARNMKVFTDQASSVTNADKVWDGTNYGLPEAYTGKDVVLGIIDDGIEYNHTAFKDSSGNSRVKAVYRPNATSAGTGGSRVTIDGVTLSGYQYTTSAGISALTTDDTSASHGTHTTGCAGGSKVGNYSGMAPEVDLVLCGAGEGDGLTETAILNSAKYIANYAKNVGKPCVISISLGSETGPHDGKSGISIGYDEIAEQYGAVILLAAGNEADCTGYATKTLSSNSDAMAVIHTPISSMSNYGLYIYGVCDVWNSTSDQLKVQVKVLNSSGTAVYTSDAMSNGTISASTLSSYFTSVTDGGIEIAGSVDANNGRYNLNIVPYLGTNKGSYKLAYVITGSAGNIINVFTENNYSQLASSGSISGYTLSKGQNEGTMCDDMTGNKTISVGAMCSRLSVPTNYGSRTTNLSNGSYNQGDIAYFSSYGTDYNGVNHPFITAPGHSVVSSLNRHDTSGYISTSYCSYRQSLGSSTYDYWGWMSGTSMATPISAGVVALYLQANPTLDVDGVKEVIKNTATTFSNPSSPAKQRGNGIINALAGIEYILNNTTTPTITANPTAVAFGDQVAGGTYTQTFTVTGENLEGNITLAKSGSSAFTIDKTSVTKATAEGNGATVTVTFKPTAGTTANYTGTVTLTSSNASSLTVSLTGKGVYTAPAITANPTSLSFTGNSGTTYTKTVTVTGTNLQGNITAAISGDANGFYSVSPTTINNSNGSASRTVTVTWAPTAGGTSTANLVLTTTGTGASSVTVPITGTAQGPTITANPTSVTFTGAYATRTYTQAVTVTGTNLTQNITASISGANVYSIDNTSLPTTGGTITVTYAPIAAGNTTATLTLSSTGASSVTVPITGTAQAATPTLIVSPSALSFTDSDRTKTFAVTGRFINEDVTLTLNDASGAFALGSATIPASSISETKAVNVTVNFTAEEEGDYTGTVTVASDGAASQTVNLNASISNGGTASDAYLNIAKYATIDEAGATVSGMSSIYKYTEYADDACAWLTVSNYGAQQADANQNWFSIEKTKNTSTSWNANDVFLGDDSYFGSNTSYAAGWVEAYQHFYVTNCTQIKQYAYNRSNTTYPLKIYIYECTENADGTLTAATTAIETLQNTTKSTEVLTSGTLDASKIYKVSVYNDYSDLYEIGFQTPLNVVDVPAITNVDPTTTTAEVTWTSGENNVGWNLRYREYIEQEANHKVWDFEDEAQFNEFTKIDVDADGFNWQYFNNEGLTTGLMTANGGYGLVASASYDKNSKTALSPNNWLITPQVQLGGKISFYACGQDGTYYSEKVGVYVFAGDSWTSVNEFTQVNSDITITHTMTKYEFDLSAYEGKGYVAIVHHNITDMFWLNIDDIEITPPEGEWIYVNNVTSPYTIDGLTPETTYEVQVQGIGDNGKTSSWTASTIFTTLGGISLAELERNGTVGTNYTVSDELVAVDYAIVDDAIYLWCKDQGNAIAPAPAVGDKIDYLGNDQYAQNGRAWDESNWVALKFSVGSVQTAVTSITSAKGHKINAGTITGVYSDATNYTIAMPEGEGLPTGAVGDEFTYTPNVYCVANFNPAYLTEDGAQLKDNGNVYFFMTPKVQEVCEITYAYWNAENFIVPTTSGFVGSLSLDWTYNEAGNITSQLNADNIYRFKTIVQRTGATTLLPALKAEGGAYKVAPLNLTSTSKADIPTAIGTVKAGVDVVDVYYVNSTGLMSKTPFQGVNIIVTRYSDGSRTTVKKVFK